MRSIVQSVLPLCCALAFALAGAVAAATPGVAVQAGAGEATLTLGGLIQAQFEDGDRGDARFPATGADRFFLRRARLNASGQFKEDFDFKVELDLTGSLSAAAGLRAQLTDGYLTWTRNSAANVRLGQFKTPFGFEQLYGDPKLLTAERSLVNDRLTLGRQLGVQVAGDGLGKRLSYAVGTFNGNGVNTNANDNSKFLWAGRVSGVPWKGGAGSWAVGGNAFRSEDTALSLPDLGFDSTPATADKDNVFSGKRHGFGLDSQVEAGPFSFWAEYLKVRFEPLNRRPAAELEADGGYLQAAWFAVPQRLQVVVKSERFDPNRDLTGDDVRTDTLGLTYYIKGHDLKVMLNYLRTDLGAKNPASTQNKLMLRAQVIF